jgi:lipopolysaccharide heptosyltransferase II
MMRLVILAPNWLGDAVMALPAIADVRRARADAYIGVAARAAVAPLFTLVSDVNATITLGGPASMRGLTNWKTIGTELSDGGFDAALLLPNSVHAALVALRGGIRERWGYGGQLRSPLLTRAVPRRRATHQVDDYRQLVGALGFPNGAREPRITIPHAALTAADRLLRETWDGSAPLVAIAPGAAYGGAKRWPPERFGELAAALASDGVECVLVGTAADKETATDVERACHARLDGRTPHGPRRIALHTVVGRTDLPTLAGVLARCRALVTNDSGAMHLAAAAGVPVTAIFGPTNERATHPVGDAHVVLSHPVWCRPCMLRECPIDHRCMRGVAVATVAEAARRSLR